MERESMIVARTALTGTAAILAAGMAMAATVTINPPAGSVTNALAFASGDDVLAVNTGTTGGTVHLNPYSTHTGGTTLGSGTLVLAQPVGADDAMGELGAGPFVQKGGTLRYTGPAGGTWTRAMTNTASAAQGAVVWQIDNDLTMACDVAQTVGAFVKTGSGTLTLAQPFRFGGTTTVADNTRRTVMNLSPDRAPTQGHSNFTIVDGTVVIDTDPGSTAASGPVTNVLTGAGIMTIGACTTLDGVETTGVLEHRSGITRTVGNLSIGFCNGSTHNSEDPLSPTLRVTGGRFLVGPAGAHKVYMGVNQSVSDFVDQRNAPRLEVTSGQRMVCKGIHMGYTPGANSTIIVRDGGYLYGLDSHVVVGDYAKYSNPQPTTNYVEVTGSGTWMSFQNFYNDNKTNGMVTTFRIADGGTVEMRNFVNRIGGADRPRGELHLIVDGGTWRHRNHDNATPHIPSSMTSVKVGPGGFYTFFNNGKETHPVIFEKGIEPLDDSGTDGGLHVTKGSGAMPPLRLNAANTYCGPTEITFTRVYLGKQGELPSGTALTVSGDNGGLIITNGIVQTVGSFTFGADASANSPILGFGPGSRLDVTGEMHVGAAVSAPKLHLFETQGGTNGLSSAGTYTFVTAPADYARDLMVMAGQFTFPYKPDDVDYTCFVDVEGDRALLKIAVTQAGTPATVGDTLIVPSVLATTNAPAAADVAAACAILTNPDYSSSGTVELGDLVDFGVGGTLTAWGGFTRVSNLSFVQSVTNLVLGHGSLVYTGSSAEIPGFTIDTSSGRSSVLSVAETNTTLSIRSLNAVSGSLSKMGPGTLHLGGTGEIVLPKDLADNDKYNGVTAAGIGPGSGHRTLNVNEGRLEIGTVGDPTDAPTVTGSGGASIGSQSHRTGQGIQTAGELVMNNGSLSIPSYFYIGYYSGRYDDCPDIVTRPTITVNGGLIDCNVLRLGYANTTYYQTASPSLRIHAGTVNVSNELYAAYAAVPLRDTYRAEVTVDGTGVLSVGTHLYGGASKAAGVDLTVAGNGRLEVGDTLYVAYNNQAETNTFRLSGNGVVRARNISGNNVNRGLNAYFDGGTYESLVNTTANSSIANMQHAYIGAGGLNVDLSHQSDLNGPTTYWLVTQQKFEHDPDLGDTPDGGMTFSGAGTISLGNNFESSTFNGGIRIRNGARVLVAGGHVAPFAVEVGPGSRLFDYDGGNNMVKNLTLGAAGATDPVVIEIERETGSYGIIVTNELSILSPVTVTTHAGTHDLSPYPVAGTYTALVYSASCPDVDLNLFTVSSEDATYLTLAATQVTVADGSAYDGMKAVVVTIAGAAANGNVWTSVTAGGNWSDTANWSNPAAGAPNGARRAATFNPATKAGVGVNLDEAVTLGGLTFTAASNAKYGYKLSGQGLTLDNGAELAVVSNAKGTNIIASGVTLASNAQLQTTSGNELRVTGGVSGSGALEINTQVETGAGQVNLKVNPGFAGTIRTGSGRVVMDDLSMLSSADQLTIGRGTLLYTGGDTECAGLTFSTDLGHAAAFAHDADVTLRDLKSSGKAAFIKLGKGTLYLRGTGSCAPNTSSNRVSATSKMSANGDTPISATVGFAVANGKVVMGVAGDDANAPKINSTVTFAIGTPATVAADRDLEFDLENGTLATTTMYLGYYRPSSTPPSTITFRQNGGTLEATGSLQYSYWNKSRQSSNSEFIMNGGTAWFGSHIYMGRTTKSLSTDVTCRLEVNGGSFATAGNFHMAYSNEANTAYVDLNGGVLTCSNTFYAAYGAGNDTTLRLNPGATFRCNAYAATAASSTSRFYGNGGTFRPLCRTAAAQTMANNVFTHLYASTNGLVVDTSETLDGAPFTLAQAVETDPALGGEKDGGLVKRGAGLLTLSGVNTYTGMTSAEGGVLALSGDGTLGGGLSVANGAICDLGGVARAVADVTTSGLVRNGALTVTGGLLVGESVLSVYGDLTLGNALTVDFAGRSDLDLRAGEPIAVVTGTATLPNSARAANAGNVTSVVFARDGNVIYAVAAPSGTTLIFR